PAAPAMPCRAIDSGFRNSCMVSPFDSPTVWLRASTSRDHLCRRSRRRKVGSVDPADRLLEVLLVRPLHQLANATCVIEVHVLSKHRVEPVEVWSEHRLALIGRDPHCPINEYVH